jgi:hypothetical protein
LLSRLPEGDIVDLAVEFDIVVDAELDLSALFVEIIKGLATLAKSEGLPLHKYNREDLEALPPKHLRALAALLGQGPDLDALLKHGKKIYKRYTRDRPKSQIPLVLPMLLEPLARFAFDQKRDIA